ncbi:restriction endonuclease subunit S [Nocardioides currus]|uniref:Type I restriction modification DNA specificity domain-containing protein n=1 Tax=Nocardioides currus TaxID=2133958 RepID=A0A2R7YRI6_9ACTN|nr:restriction endonuclease subunit S [Nocardioides currus]PUA78951.1 hypothetical protein C7S10_21720 [Nocardioides currus]
MTVREVRIGTVLRPNRRWVKVDELAEYVAIVVRGFGRGIFHYEPTVGSDLGKLRFFRVESDSLVVSNIKAWEGAVAVSGSSEDGTIASNRFLSYEPIDGQADVNFLRHYLLTEEGNQRLQRASPGSADRNRTLAASRFEDILVPLPSPSEQQRIVARLDRVASTAAGLGRTRAPLARVKARVLAIAEASALPARPMKDLVRAARTPIDIEADQSYRPLGVRSFGKGLIRYPATKGEDLSKLRYYSVQPNRLVVSNIKAWEGAVAMTCDGDEDLVASTRFLQWEVADPAAVDLQYLRLFFATQMGLSLLGRASPGSADRNRTLSSPRFLDISIPLPPLAQQQRLVDLAHQIETIEAQLQQRDVVSSALLPAARNEAFAGLT